MESDSDNLLNTLLADVENYMNRFYNSNIEDTELCFLRLMSQILTTIRFRLIERYRGTGELTRAIDRLKDDLFTYMRQLVAIRYNNGN